MTSETSSQEAVQCPLGLLKRLLSGPSRCENPSHSETHTGARHVIERALGHPLPLFEVSHCSRFLSCGPDIVELKQDESLLPDGVPGENKEEGEGFILHHPLGASYTAVGTRAEFGASLWMLPKQEPKACSPSMESGGSRRPAHLGAKARNQGNVPVEGERASTIQPWELGPKETCMEVDFRPTEVASWQHQSVSWVSSLCV